MWLAFAVAAAVVLAAMGYVTATVLRLDAAEGESRRRARLEENVRLALWRMDSALAPLIAAEHARPASAFVAPVTAQQRVRSGPAPQMRTPAPLIPPPLPGDDAAFVRLYFQFRSDGTLTSPQVAGPEQLEAVQRLAPHGVLLAAIPPGSALDEPPAPLPDAVASVKGGKEQALRNSTEYQARAANQMQQQAYAGNLYQQQQVAPAAVAGGVMAPVWVGEELILARRPGRADVVVQGCWVDWPAVRRWLLKSSADLLPTADLLPLAPGATDPEARMLASLPVKLVPGELPAAAVEARPSPLRVSLAVAWACVLLAVGAVAVLLRGVVALSERRGAFVSAVTHELRTPLTTLRMYTEMLEGGMVSDPGQRQKYLATLRAEADRLGHLVENVLAYSRLERNRAGYQVTAARLEDVLGRAVERLTERARHTGMELVATVPADVAALSVRTNALALEQILFNLVDNACKYAGAAADKRIELSAAGEGNAVVVRVRDHGPGIAPAQAARLFRAFSKTAQEAANTAPGLGLGLALSRRLAQSMGGDLALDNPAGSGAAFVVTLPRA
jgi:signal transduction histidine kinase